MSGEITISAAGSTDVGRVRSSNQDSYAVDPATQLYIVADGMGGHTGGEIASALCVEEVRKFLDEHRAILQSAGHQHPNAKISNLLADAINHASTRIYERALENPSLRGMGTTATIMKIVDDYAYIGHVGDSRCYLLRCDFIYQITNDHSLVGEQVRAGIITKEEAESHNLRNVITRSVGYQEVEDVDTTSISLEDGDVFLICSDGLFSSRKVSDKEIAEHLKEHPAEAPAKLVALANARGGDDNITVVVIKVKVSK